MPAAQLGLVRGKFIEFSAKYFCEELLWALRGQGLCSLFDAGPTQEYICVGNLTQASNRVAYDGLLTKNPYRSSSSTWQQR
jgi:hypothetical protein